MNLCISLLVLSLLSASAANLTSGLPDSIHPNEVNGEIFSTWASEHEHPYADPDHPEHQLRYGIFKENVNLIHQHNQKGLSWSLGLGPFTAMTHEEFKSKYIMEDFDLDSLNETLEMQPYRVKAPASVDWRGKYVTGVKQQGQCGACWSFSVAAAIEGCKAQAGKGLVQLSEQAQLDCIPQAGCKGYDTFKSLGWIKTTGAGLPTDRDYPYRAVKQRCLNKQKVAKISGYYTAPKTEAGLMNLLAAGVVSVSFQGDLADFMHYKSGVYNSAGCSGKINHAVAAVGYGSNCAGSKSDCFIGKNSWGTKWGQNGFFYIARRGNKCSFTSRVARPFGCS